MKKGFTLIEVMAAMAILALLVLVLAKMFVVAGDTAKKGTDTISRNSTAELGIETLLRTFEGMVVNDRIGAFLFGPGDAADKTGFGHDEAYFLSTETITTQNKAPRKSYEYVNFYVTERTLTNVTGAVYTRYDLMYRYHNYASWLEKHVDALDPNDAQWWDNSYLKSMQSDVLIPNIVRFDIYAFDYYGDNAMTWDTAADGRRGMIFDSTNRSANGISNVPPAAIDIYIQVASEDTAVEAGQLIASGDSTLAERGREMLVRDSAVYFARAVPVTGPARFLEFKAGKPGHYYKD